MGWNTQQQKLSTGVLVAAGLLAMQAAAAAPPPAVGEHNGDFLTGNGGSDS